MAEDVRIAVISTPFVPVPPPRYGGTELVVAGLCGELGARGHEVVLYATGDSAPPGPVHLRALYPTAVWPPDPTRELAHCAFALADLLAEGGVDLVHAHAAPALACARRLGVPLVYTVHHHRDEALCELYRAVQDPGVTMVCISERQRELLADACAARVVHHGLDARRYPLGAGTGGYAAFLGRFAREKGVHVALDVARAAGVPLRLGGAPHWRDEAYFAAEVAPRLERRRAARWLGEVGHAPKVALLSGAVATLFPIDWEEPFGLVMVESMLAGTPVLAFPRGAAGEVVEDGVTGWLVPDAEAMADRLRWLHRGGRFDRARCRRRAALRFGVGRMVDGYLAAYATALGRRAGAHARGSRARLP